MDGLAEDSPLISAVLAADFIDRLTENWLLLFIVALAISVSFSCGNQLDVWLTLCFAAWRHTSVIASTLRSIGLAQLSHLIFVIFITSLVWYHALRCMPPCKADAWHGAFRPLLVPSRTTHTRLLPKKHSFSAPSLFAGVPADFSGNANGMISANVPSSSTLFSYLFGSRAWFDVNSVDHLHCRCSDNGLRRTLDAYLESENINPLRYPHAYLFSTTRFPASYFSPTSFWFLYSSEMIFSAIILEMNTIFGERHPYLVTRDFEAEAKHIQDVVQKCRLEQAQKNFQVSPFNSPKGPYLILASDPFGPEGFRGLDITINLSSSKDHPKLITKLFSESEALDPYKLSLIQKTSFIYSWFWAGLAIFPRFIKQSVVLLIKHKLRFWYRPEPLIGSVGRLANGIERLLEQVFREYLKHLAQQSPIPITIRYSSSGVAEASEEILMSHPAIKSRDPTNEIKIKVLTPVFYSRFVHYAHDSEAIFSELAESCTFWTDKPEQLTKVFLKKRASPLHTSNLFDYMRFQLIKNLRRRPDKIGSPLTSTDKQLPLAKGVDIRSFRMSSMDAFVLGQEDIRLKKAYGMAVARLFVADHISSGSTDLLGMMELVVRMGASWLLVSLVTQGIACFS